MQKHKTNNTLDNTTTRHCMVCNKIMVNDNDDSDSDSDDNYKINC